MRLYYKWLLTRAFDRIRQISVKTDLLQQCIRYNVNTPGRLKENKM